MFISFDAASDRGSRVAAFGFVVGEGARRRGGGGARGGVYLLSPGIGGIRGGFLDLVVARGLEEGMMGSAGGGVRGGGEGKGRDTVACLFLRKGRKTPRS